MAKKVVKEAAPKGKAALVKAVREAVDGVTIDAAKTIVTAVYDEIQTRIVEDGEFYMDGIGTFKTIVRSPRTGRNPATGEAIEIGEKRILKFKQSRNIKGELND